MKRVGKETERTEVKKQLKIKKLRSKTKELAEEPL